MRKITLKKLEKSDIPTLEDKELWFAGFDADNLDFFENNYPMLCHNVSRICALLPIDHRTTKKHYFAKKNIQLKIFLT